MIKITSDNQNEFWRRVGCIGVGGERTNYIPMEVVLDDGSVTRENTSVLNKWTSDFELLLNPEVSSERNQDYTLITEPQELSEESLNAALTMDEVRKV